MTLNCVTGATLRYFTEFGKPAFQHNRFRAQEKKFTFAISSADELFLAHFYENGLGWRQGPEELEYSKITLPYSLVVFSS